MPACCAGLAWGGGVVATKPCTDVACACAERGFQGGLASPRLGSCSMPRCAAVVPHPATDRAVAVAPLLRPHAMQLQGSCRQERGPLPRRVCRPRQRILGPLLAVPRARSGAAALLRAPGAAARVGAAPKACDVLGLRPGAG